ncbi:MAG: cation transporter dimerization domain-containing protein, partial [Rectinemataceae bacterium]
LVVDLDIEVEPTMSVREAHEIAVKVENSIKDSLPDIYDVIVHIEPLGNVEEERFGLTIDDTAH